MIKTKEFIFMCEHMGGTTWTVEYQWAIEGEAQEIVRCKDCRHYADHGEAGVCKMPCGDSTAGRAWAKPDGFCAWGEVAS